MPYAVEFSIIKARNKASVLRALIRAYLKRYREGTVTVELLRGVSKDLHTIAANTSRELNDKMPIAPASQLETMQELNYIFHKTRYQLSCYEFFDEGNIAPALEATANLLDQVRPS